jgi:hypothetical protein
MGLFPSPWEIGGTHIPRHSGARVSANPESSLQRKPKA